MRKVFRLVTAAGLLLFWSCSASETYEPEQVEAGLDGRHCYRNEVPSAESPGDADVEELTVVVDGAQAMGTYSSLPAFKGRRVGRLRTPRRWQTPLTTGR